MQAISRIEKLKMEFELPYSTVLKEVNFTYSTFMRWKRRIANGQKLTETPGPKKVEPFDLKKLNQKIETLDHGKKRSRGTTALHKAYKGSISRRELDAMIQRVRRGRTRNRSAAMSRVIWHRPDVVWALDGIEYDIGFEMGKLHVQNLQDLCSQYKFPALVTGHLPCGEEVAGHLDRHFTSFGPPLFLKRDNGGNLNHLSVNQLLEEAMVIPINSPVGQAPYNGAIEHTQGEIKAYLTRWKEKAKTFEEFALMAHTSTHDLNHKPRRALSGKTACQSYFNKNRIRYSRRRRKAVYRWIRDLAIDISLKADKNAINSLAWRIAAKKWLVKNKLITIIKDGKVLPYFSSNLCHN
jgi:hypothetical protein